MRDGTTTIVNWTILTLDRRKPNPLPLEPRPYYLDLSEVDPSTAQQILNMVRRPYDYVSDKATPSKNDVVETLQYEARMPDFGMLRFRHLFLPKSIEEIESKLNNPAHKVRSFMSVSLLPEYMEDEQGKPITMRDVMRHVTGSDGILLDDPESVLAVGPCSPRDVPGWTAESANSISHFLYVVRKLTSSRWYRSPLSLSHVHSSAGEVSFHGYIAPNRESTLEILALVRQIYASDDLFNKAVNIYLRHVDHEGKRFWVKHVKTQFNSLRETSTKLPSVGPKSRRQLLDAFIYGARLMHSKPDDDAETVFQSLLSAHGIPQVMMAVNAAMKDLIARAVLAAHPVQQDFAHWVADCGLSAPTATKIDPLFQPHKRLR